MHEADSKLALVETCVGRFHNMIGVTDKDLAISSGGLVASLSGCSFSTSAFCINVRSKADQEPGPDLRDR